MKRGTKLFIIIIRGVSMLNNSLMTMIIMKCFFLLTVGLVQSNSGHRSHIFARAGGNFSGPWTVKFGIFVEEALGLVLYANDYSNRLLVKFVTDSVTVAFNNKKGILLLNDICGSSSCGHSTIHFNVRHEADQTTFTVTSNRVRKEKILDEAYKDEEWERYPSFIDQRNVTQFWMANTGTHINNKNVKINDLKDQLRGCLEIFYFNKAALTFVRNGKDFNNTCQGYCPRSLCNDGRCRKGNSSDAVCDCSETTLNGPYCNKSLIDYSSQNKSFLVRSTKDDNILKFSWRHSNSGPYCLMELTNGSSTVSIFVDGENVKVYGERVAILGKILNDREYYISVTVSQYHVDIAFRGNKTERSLRNAKEIYVGYSHIKKCGIFEGKYDFRYNESALNIITRQNNSQASLKQRDTKSTYILRILSFCGFVLLTVFISINILTAIKKKRANLNVDRTKLEYNQACSGTSPGNNNTADMIYDLLDDVYDGEVLYTKISDDFLRLHSVVEFPALPPRIR